MLGTVDLVVKYGDQIATLTLSVVKGEGPSLLGRNWLKLDWREIFKAVFEPGGDKVTTV